MNGAESRRKKEFIFVQANINKKHIPTKEWGLTKSKVMNYSIWPLLAHTENLENNLEKL